MQSRCMYGAQERHQNRMKPVSPAPRPTVPLPRASLLAWPAWCRVLALVPVLSLLWAAAFWALAESAAW